MSYKIDRGIPLPTGYFGRKYPYADLAVGESFLDPHGNNQSISSGSSYAGKKLGRKFSVRKTSEGIRCWRIA